MNIHFGFPNAFYALFALIPAILVTLIQWKRFSNVLGSFFNANKNVASKKIFFRSFFWCLSWISIVIALSSPYWGTKPVLVQTNGKAVSLVFDISYSMNAQDGDNSYSKTRLQVAQEMATTLVSNSKKVAFSCVVAKGNGLVAVPLTEDVFSVQNLIDNLSPAMLSTPGTALDKGIEAALTSFPRQSSRKAYIVLFTDGDETIGSLQASIEKAVAYGIHVIVVGVGSEQGREIMTGDGVTNVHTSYKKNELYNLCKNVNNSVNNILENSVQLINAKENSSVYKLYSSINTDFYNHSSEGVTYEIKPINHYKLFVLLAIVFFVLGIIVTELNFSSIKKTFTTTSIVLSLFLTLGCSQKLANTSKVLSSTFHWHNKNYNKAIAGFMQITEDAKKNNDKTLLQYGIFGLSTSYLMQAEDMLALEKLESIAEDAPNDVKFGSYYNMGVIAHKKGDYAKAIIAFKEALLLDSTNVNAKINLELSQNAQQSMQESAQKQVKGVSESPYQSTIQDKLFSLIKESEQEKWKNSQQGQDQSNILDY